MNGVDVSWAVIEGEFGLDRPGEMTPTVIYRLLPVAVPYSSSLPSADSAPKAYGSGYFPKTGIQPGYGRLEIQPPPDRLLPSPAPSFRKSWSSQSAPGPATEYAPFPTPPVDVSIWGGRNWHGGHHETPGPNQGPGQDGQGPGQGPGSDHN